MKGSIVNRSRRTVSIRLNTGQTRHIPPRAELEGVLEAEVQNNAMIKKLIDRRVIGLRGFGTGPTSTSMKADAAVAHIKNTSLEDLGHFVSPDEERASVLRAWEKKQEA